MVNSNQCVVFSEGEYELYNKYNNTIETNRSDDEFENNNEKWRHDLLVFNFNRLKSCATEKMGDVGEKINQMINKTVGELIALSPSDEIYYDAGKDAKKENSYYVIINEHNDTIDDLRTDDFSKMLIDEIYRISTFNFFANFRHIVSCKKFPQYRSVLHNAVRDVTYEMFKCYNFSCKAEPLLKHYSDDNLFNSRRGDLIAPFVDSCQVVVVSSTVDPFAFVYRDDVLLRINGHLNKAEDRKTDKYTEILIDLNKNLYSKFSFVSFAFSIFGRRFQAEDRKTDKYTEILIDLNKNLYSKFSFVSFALSIFGNIGQSALSFINDFGNLCRSSGDNFVGNLCKNRIIFALYRSVPKYLSLMMSNLYKNSSRVAVENFVSYVF
ncbi:hypothetical protein P9112_001274 [Eukaryota sp. TZLM1-RC]